MSQIRIQLTQWAQEEGLLLLGVSQLEHPDASHRFQSWLKDGNHAGMSYLERNNRIRLTPSEIFAGAKSAVIFALPYRPASEAQGPQAAGYACYPDYHRVLKTKLLQVWRRIQSDSSKFRVLVDSAPVLEKALAENTELGFIGKNTCYIHPSHGSFLLLGEVVTSLAIEPDIRFPLNPSQRTEAGGCATCTACQVNCPTGALDSAYRLDSRRCLAYWTIENRGPIPIEFWPYLETYWYGCDICQTSCPFNSKSQPASVAKGFTPFVPPELPVVACLDQGRYEAHFGGTPFIRAKRGGLRRNALIAMVVTGHPELPNAIDRAKADPIHPLLETIEQIPLYRLRFEVQ